MQHSPSPLSMAMERLGKIDNRSLRYSGIGFILGIFAPLGWIVLEVLFTSPENLSIFGHLRLILMGTSRGTLMLIYMGLGTSVVMGAFGFCKNWGFLH